MTGSPSGAATPLPDREAPGFEYRRGVLHAEELPVPAIARAVGTPSYLYSAGAIRAAYRRIRDAFAPLGARLHYAVKASSNLHLLALLRAEGAGMDVVSGGELERAWLAGTPMGEIVFAGVGKTDAELRAALDGRFSPLAGGTAGSGAAALAGGEIPRPRIDAEAFATRGPVGMVNVESVHELERLAAIAAELGVEARACVRVNPDVDARTHEYTTTGRERNKFGIDAALVPGLFDVYRGHRWLRLVGLHVHIGSPVREIEPYVAAVEVVSRLLDRLAAAGHAVSTLDLGGGWAIDYRPGEAPAIEAYAEALVPLLSDRVGQGLDVVLEPGRYLLANAGVLVTRVQHVKKRERLDEPATRPAVEPAERVFAVCDAGMNTLLRPALYRAYHFLWPAVTDPRRAPAGRPLAAPAAESGLVETSVVGPVCESADFLALDRPLPAVAPGDLLAVFSAGAYAMSMSSNYNDLVRPAEVLVDGTEARLINERQTLVSLLVSESRPRILDLGPGGC